MEFGYWVGWLGVFWGLLVPVPQLVKIIKTKKLADVSLGTYAILMACLICYLTHAIHIKAEVFICAQSVNLCTNGVIFFLLIKDRRRSK